MLGILCFVTDAQATARQTVTAKEVLTGDSIRIEGGKTLKYAGIQAPPLQSIIPLVRQYGEESQKFNQQLVLGKKLLVEWGPQIRDDRGNLMSYVYLEDGTFVNEQVLRNGHAKQRLVAPNLKYSGILRQAELGARRERKGLWVDEPENPYIKSEYIGDKNTKTYYFPTSPELERIPESYLVKFRSRVEAKAAGYKPCFSCNEDNVPYEE